MPATTAIAAPGASSLDTAKAALASFKLLCPDLSIFATVLAGRDPEMTSGPKARLTVVPGPATCTDGRTIYIRPDARLAGNPTDAEWSAIKAGLFHEVAHVVFDSFKATSDDERGGAVRAVTEGMEDSYRKDALLRTIAAAGDSYMAIAQAWHRLMPMLLNALEDARVEALLFAAKPGTHKHLEASRVAIFDAPKAEVEALIGTAWIDRDTDSQAIIGTYLIGAGYAPEGRLTDEVAAVLRKIEPHILAATTAEDVTGVYAAAFGVLSALQANGYLRNGDERDEPVGETPHDESEPAAGEAGGSGDSTGCAHPKAAIVECADARCQGNCTLCGAHIVASEAEGAEGEGEGAEGAESAPEAAAKAAPGEDTAEAGEDAGEDTAEAGEDAGEGAGGEGESEDADEATAAPASEGGEGGEGDGPKAESATVAGPDDGSENVGSEAKDAKVETDLGDLHDALHAAGGHDEDLAASRLSDDDLSRALTLDENGYGDDENLVACVTGIKVGTTDKPSRHMMGSDRGLAIIDTNDCERAIATVLPEMRKALAVNGRTGFTPHQRSGRVDTRALYKTATGETKVFGRFTRPESRDYLFVIALDCSGSMSSADYSERYESKWKVQKALAYAEAEMLNRLGIPFLMFGYSGNNSGGGFSLAIQMVRANGEAWDDAAKARLGRLDAHSANLDGSTMQYARILGRNATRNPRTKVVVLYHNDGGMPAENSRAEGAQIKAEVRNQAKHNVHFVGVGIKSADVGGAGLDLVLCNDVSDVAKVTAKIASEMGVA